MLRRLIASTATIAIAALSMAGPQTYANKQQSIGVGVVVLSSSVASSAPYAWMVLDDASRIKPAGWNISNPGGSTYVTSEIASRWSASGATVGGKLSKRNAAYWEVNLSNISDTLLAQYNVLLISPAATTSITPLERERLRGFVDRGGVLWVEASIQATTSRSRSEIFLHRVRVISTLRVHCLIVLLPSTVAISAL